jgi:hypothetical protein
LHEEPQPHGQVLYDLVTGHPDREPQDLVFLADLTVELRGWPQQPWTAVGISPEAALLAVADRWRAGHLKGVELGGVSAEEARALARPAMTYVREQLRKRLSQQISRRTCAGCTPLAAAGQATRSCSQPDARGSRACAVSGRHTTGRDSALTIDSVRLHKRCGLPVGPDRL